MPPKKKTDETQPEAPLSPELAAIYFTRAELLRVLGNVHSDTLARWQKRGIGPPQTVLPGRQIVFSKTSFFQWTREREQQPKRVRQSRRAGAQP